MNTTTTIIVGLVGSGFFSILLSELCTFIRERQKSESEDELAIKSALQALLRDRLQEGYAKYTALGYCPLDEKQNLHNLYMAYHNMNLPNGVMEHCDIEIMNLPESQAD